MTRKGFILDGLPSLFSRYRQAVDTERALHEKRATDLHAEIGRLTTQLAWIEIIGIEPDEG